MEKFKDFTFWNEEIWKGYFYGIKNNNYPRPLLDIKTRINSYKKKPQKGNLKILKQLERDETYWTASTLIPIFENKRNDILIKILNCAFADIPPLKDFHSWKECISGKPNLLLEEYFPSPKSYTQVLTEESNKRNIIPYIYQQTINCYHFGEQRTSLMEGATHVDAHIWNDRINIFVESKVLSDISNSIKFDVKRNQIARTIDIMLSHDSNNSLFLLITPKIFQDNWKTRFYGYKMHDYKEHPSSLKEDLQHRKKIKNWTEISKRLGWITWEDIIRIGEKAGIYDKDKLFISNFPEIIETCSKCSRSESGCKFI